MKIRAIRFPENGEERIEKVVNRSNSRPTGKYPSWKMGRMMQWKTVAHLNAFRLLDADSRVSSFQELPMAIEYEGNGSLRVERPDLLVVIGAHKELWTIKKLSEIHSQDQKNEMKELAMHLLARGYQQRLIDIDVLEQEPMLSNAITLLGFGRGEISPLEREAFRILFIEREGHLSWGEVINGVAGPLGRNILCRLVLEGVVRFDPTALWTDLMLFYWTGDGIDHVEGGI